jgi:hypothetical protein
MAVLRDQSEVTRSFQLYCSGEQCNNMLTKYFSTPFTKAFILSQINVVHAIVEYLILNIRSILVLSSYLRLTLPCCNLTNPSWNFSYILKTLQNTSFHISLFQSLIFYRYLRWCCRSIVRIFQRSHDSYLSRCSHLFNWVILIIFGEG